MLDGEESLHFTSCKTLQAGSSDREHVELGMRYQVVARLWQASTSDTGRHQVGTCTHRGRSRWPRSGTGAPRWRSSCASKDMHEHWAL